MAINWELARIPDFVGNALQARDQATQRGLEMERRNALQEYARNPQAGVQRLMAVDPEIAVRMDQVNYQRRRDTAADERQARLDAAAAEAAATAGGWKERTRPDGSTELVWLPATPRAGAPNAPAQPAPMTQPQAPMAGSGATASLFDDFYQNYLAPAEGGYAPNDGNGAPVNFGINQGANPDIDVRGLTQDQAKQITFERYWKPSGADQLPPALAAIQADTAFNMGLNAAQRLLTESGGDPQKYLSLREARYKAIAAANPDKQRFLPTWLRRNQALAAYVGGLGAEQQPQAQPMGAQGLAQQPLMQEAGGEGIPWSAPDRMRALQIQNLEGQIAERNKQQTPAAVPAQVGIEDLGGGFFRDPAGRVYQRNDKGKLEQTVGITDTAVSTSVRNITDLNNVQSAIAAFKRAMSGISPKDFGPLGKYAGDPQKYATAKAAATDLMMLLKSPGVYNLGVITGPDMSILEGMVSDPAKFDSVIRQGQILPQIAQLERSIISRDRGEREAFRVLGGNPQALPRYSRDQASQSGPQGLPAELKRGQDGNFYAADPTKPGSFPKATRNAEGKWYIKLSTGDYGEVY